MNHNHQISNKKDKSSIDMFDFMIALLFFGSLLMRLVAASKLPLNAYESALLIGNPGKATVWENPISLIESILIKPTYFMVGQSQFGARVWPAMAGSMLMLIPLYIKEVLGKKMSMVLALLLMIEPFLLGNSLQVGGHIFAILGLSLIISAWLRNNIALTIIGGSILFLSGRGLFPALLIIAMLYFLNRKFQPFFSPKSGNNNTGNLKVDPRLGFTVAIVFTILFISYLKIDLSALFSSLSAFIPQTTKIYFRQAEIPGLPVVFLSYAPLSFALFIIFCYRFRNKEKTLVLILLILVATLSLWAAITPAKNYSDLVWVTLPMLIGSAYYLSNFSVPDCKSSWMIMLLISIILTISLLVSFSQFIYHGRYRISQGNSVINMITILFLFIFVYFTYLTFGSGRRFLRATGMSILIIGFVFQATSTFRAGGISSDVSQELLWSGAIADADIVTRTVDMRSNSNRYVGEEMQIGLEKGLSPQLMWILKDENISSFPAGISGPLPLDIVITKENSIQLFGKYVGQSLTVDAYPKWIETPLNSLFDYDYWSWLIFRNSNLEKVTHHIWYAME